MSDIRKTERGLTSPSPPNKIRMRIGFPFFVVIADRATREREREKAITETYCLHAHNTYRGTDTLGKPPLYISQEIHIVVRRNRTAMEA